VYWAVRAAFPAWCEEQPAEARQALRHLWDEAGPVSGRVDRFASDVERTAIGGRGRCLPHSS
jgi:hypothetical protein